MHYGLWTNKVLDPNTLYMVLNIVSQVVLSSLLLPMNRRRGLLLMNGAFEVRNK
jgi:hypothetical protein